MSRAEKITEKLSSIARVEDGFGVVKIKCSPSDVISVCEILKKEFKVNGFVGAFGSHYSKPEDITRVRYMLISHEDNFRVEVIADVKNGTKALSLSGMYAGAEWYEREIFDMCGVEFFGLEDHRRILTDYNFEHHPLRKDFPVIGYREVRYDPLSEDVRYFENNFSQDYKEFDGSMDIDPSAVFEKIKTIKS